MRETATPIQSLDIPATRTIRISMTLGSVIGLLNLALSVMQVLTGDRAGLYGLFTIVLGVWLVGYFGWMAYHAWRHPILHLGSDEIRWHPIGVARPLRIPTAEVTGFRWPFPRDLWVERTGDQTLRIAIVGISRRDQTRVRAWLSDRWEDGGLVVS